MNKNKIRNILNLIFMIGAVVGVILFLSKNEERHQLGLYIILISMCFKIAESSLRMMK
ncbi:MAG: hypothetical protein IKD75_15790 [Prevotella sp.]|nr:hypothetical protein [Prevotella sp.]